MRAAGIDHKQPIRRAAYPYPVLLLPFRVDSQAVVGRVTDLEHGAGLEQSARQEESASPLFRALALLEAIHEPVHQPLSRNATLFAAEQGGERDTQSA